AAELVAARADGPWMTQRTSRDGADLAVHTSRLIRFFHSPPLRSRTAAGINDGLLAPIVFSWLARRGASATRLDPHDSAPPRELRARLAALLARGGVFAGRIRG